MQGSMWATPGRSTWRESESVYDFGLLDWRDGWFDGRVVPGRTADVWCRANACRRCSLKAAWTRYLRDCRQSQDPHTGWLPARVKLAEPSSRSSCIWCMRSPMTRMPTALNGTGPVSRRVVTHNHHRSTKDAVRVMFSHFVRLYG